MNTRNTKQKEIILNTLRQMHSHPTIMDLYEMVQKVDPSIGQATVYRNVSKLVEEGLVMKIPTNDGVDHYDGDCTNHYHFICQKCHKLYDLHDENFPSVLQKVEKNNHFKVNRVHLILEGICHECE